MLVYERGLDQWLSARRSHLGQRSRALGEQNRWGWLRRVVTMVPDFVVVGLGANATNALVISQIVLSIALPLPMIALVMFTGRADIMGEFVNGRMTTFVAIAGTIIVLLLNAVLILQTFGVPIPGLPAS